jgi:hypothetical protein
VEKAEGQAVQIAETILQEVPPKKKVAIVGFSAHKVEAPYDDKTFEIWGLNDLYEAIPRWNRWFEMHSDAQIKDYCTRKQGKPYLEGLSGLGVPVYMQKHRPEVPLSVPYPIEEVKAEFGDYFTNSISYMIAMAIREQYHTIHVYGVDMAQSSEYNFQRPSCEYFLGFARGRGIEIKLPKTSDLLKVKYLYGYEDDLRTSFEARIKEIRDGVVARKAAADQAAQQNQSASLQYMGAIDAIDTISRIHV